MFDQRRPEGKGLLNEMPDLSHLDDGDLEMQLDLNGVCDRA
jgi:hypothetical protein